MKKGDRLHGMGGRGAERLERVSGEARGAATSELRRRPTGIIARLGIAMAIALAMMTASPASAQNETAANESEPIGREEAEEAVDGDENDEEAGGSEADESDEDADDDEGEYDEYAEDEYFDDDDILSEGMEPPMQIEELVVTGSATTGLSDYESADSITSFSAEDLTALGVTSVADLGNFTPNLEIINANPTSPTFFIRGVGLSDFNANSTGAVAIFHDDVSLNSPALQSVMVFDAERINVLKGPQGFGPNRNASAGAIKVYSRKPTDELSGNLRGTFGNYNMVEFEGGLNVPLVEDLLTSRAAFRVIRRDGTGFNRCGGFPADGRPISQPFPPPGIDGSLCGENVRNNQVSDLPADLPSIVNDRNAWATRVMLRFQPDLAAMDWLLNVHVAQLDQLAPLGQVSGTNGTQRDENNQPTITGGLTFPTSAGYREPDISEMVITRSQELQAEGLLLGPANAVARQEVSETIANQLDIRPREGDYNRVGSTTNDTAGVNLRGDMIFGDGFEFTTITSFDYYDRRNEQDLDNTPDELFEIITDDEGYQFTEDLRLRFETGAFRWDVGAYYVTEEIQADIQTFTSDSAQGNLGVSDRGYTQRLHSWAIYGGFDVDFWDDLTFQAGIRYNWELKEMDYGLVLNNEVRQATNSQTRSAPTWNFRLTYHLSDTIDIYGKYGRGWKGGHFNAVGNLVTREIDFAEPETLDSWEAGVRGLWWDNKLGLEASFFYYRYNDYQVFTFAQGFNVEPELVVINANQAENYGVEADLSFRPIDQIFTLVRFGWLESQYLDFTQQSVATAISGGQTVEFPILIDNTGNRLINSPQFQITLMAEYTQDLGRFGELVPRYDVAWKSAQYFDPSEGVGPPNLVQGVPIYPENTIGQRPFWLHNIRLTYRTPVEGLEVSGWVRNLTDEVYKAGGFNGDAFSNFVVWFVGDPRTWGIDINYRF